MSNSTETLTRSAVATPKVNAPFFNYSNPVFDYETVSDRGYQPGD